MKFIIGLILLSIANTQSVTIDVPWGFGSSGTFNAQVGDTLSFRWTGSSSHTVAWQAAAFQTSPVSSTLGHTQNYTIGLPQLGQTLNAFCSIHPSMTATINVAGLPTESPTMSPNTPVPTNSPTFKPTRSPTELGVTHTPTVSPSMSPTGQPDPIVVLGYYPLYTTELAAFNAANCNSHTHILNNVTYYMPNCVIGHHGNYTDVPTRSPLPAGDTFAPTATPTSWPTSWPGHGTPKPSAAPTSWPGHSSHSPSKSPTVTQTAAPTVSGGLSTGATVGVALGGTAAVGGVAYGFSQFVLPLLRPAARAHARVRSSDFY